jgi:hypothetical protein
MELEDVRDWLKVIWPDGTYTVGTINAKRDRSVGVYQLHRQNEAKGCVGGGIQTGRKAVSLLVHWNTNATETEQAAGRLLTALKTNYRAQQIGAFTANYVRPLNNEPIDVGQDDAGVYERVVELEIYYSNED